MEADDAADRAALPGHRVHTVPGPQIPGVGPEEQDAHQPGCMQGDQWKQTTLQTALLYPGTVFALFLGLNFLVWGQKSSGAVPFGTLFALCFLWFGISVPLVFVGSYFGYRKPAPEDPVRTNKIPRQIPEQASLLLL